MNPKLKRALIHSSLFIVTLITTTMAGAEWTYGKTLFIWTNDGLYFNSNYSWSDFSSGLPYSFCFLSILSCHEFGHYFVGVYNRVKTSLPYYIPLPFFNFSVGTLGAMIRIRSRVKSARQNFDIGLAGPLAGFIVSLCFLIYGFVNLPPSDYVFQFHPEYEQYGTDYASHVYDPAHLPKGVVDVIIGKNLIYVFLERVFADPERVPNPHEIMHYPFLFAGFLSLVFTCLNLLPIGQLDGGHVLYGLVGHKRHKLMATLIYVALVFYAGLGLVSPFESSDGLIFKIPLYLLALYAMFRGVSTHRNNRLVYALSIFASQYLIAWIFPNINGYPGWLLFAFVIGTFVGVRHPISEIEEPLDTKRKILGWLALLIFVLCFTPEPIIMIESPTAAP